MAMWRDIVEAATHLRAKEEPFVVATVVAFKSPQSARPGSKAIIRSDGSITGWIGGGCVQPIVIREAIKALETGRPKLISISPDESRGDWKGVESYQMTCQGGGSLEIYLEPVLPKPELLIVGNSPIAQILSGMGKLLDYKITVADPVATPARFPDADRVLTDLSGLRNGISSRTYVVVATMGTGDEEGLESVAGTEPKYLGFVASREKAGGLFRYLQDKGIPAEHLARVRCPAGVELGAETLPEIAVSVMAEITRLRRAESQSVAEHKALGEGPLPVVQKAGSEEAADARDPVCGMTVSVATARYKSVLDDQTIYFCCLRCKESFDKSPQTYSV
jgi:xanthine dehydrogenase accessory factor